MLALLKSAFLAFAFMTISTSTMAGERKIPCPESQLGIDYLTLTNGLSPQGYAHPFAEPGHSAKPITGAAGAAADPSHANPQRVTL